MAYNNLNEALAALNAIGSSGDALKADLLGLVRQVSVHAEGAVTLRYSGKASGWNGAQIVEEMLDGGRDIRVLDKTVASELVSSYAFRGRVAEAFGITLLDLDTKTSAAKEPSTGSTTRPTAPGPMPRGGSQQPHRATCGS
jgi:hypothetical protein